MVYDALYHILSSNGYNHWTYYWRGPSKAREAIAKRSARAPASHCWVGSFASVGQQWRTVGRAAVAILCLFYGKTKWIQSLDILLEGPEQGSGSDHEAIGEGPSQPLLGRKLCFRRATVAYCWALIWIYKIYHLMAHTSTHF